MTISRRWFAAAPVAFLLVGAALAQAPGGGFNVVPAPPRVNVQDKEDAWVLDFQFKSPRVITVDIPGRGRKTVWYLRYEVWNRTGAPRFFIPDFDLVTDTASFRDEVLPSVQAQIAKIEDPTGFYDVKNTTTIAAKPIPPSKQDANPIYVTGVAIFPDLVEKAPDLTKFSIFVTGLSNGWSEDPQTHVVKRKTLQLNFRRFADARVQSSDVIRFQAPVEWIYRGTGVKAPEIKPADQQDK
jgi:hypothetical protein